MPVPANTPNLTLGRSQFDKRRFRADTDPEVIRFLEWLAMGRAGAGWDGPAKKDDEVYMAVYAQPDGGGAHNLYGGNPADPVNPFPLTVSASGSATVNWEEEGVLVLSSGTANFVGSGVTVTDVAGTATITITGGGGGSVTEAFKTIAVAGQSDVVADSATDTLTLSGTGITITTNAGTDTINFANDALAFKTISVSGQSDVVADALADTLTLVAGSNVTITTNAGSDSITIASTDTNTTYIAGAGVNLSGTKFIADPNTASHVGLVDPATGDDSSADDAQIGILWHEIEGFDDGRNQIQGHVADDATKPKTTLKTTEDWLELLENYSGATSMVIGNDGSADGIEGDENVKWIPSPQKVIWGIDPDGGHTLTSTGTTLTLTLKVTKYTFDAVNFVSAVDEDVEIDYTGTEC